MQGRSGLPALILENEKKSLWLLGNLLLINTVARKSTFGHKISHNTSFISVHNNAEKKELGRHIQPSWPHSWSIARIFLQSYVFTYLALCLQSHVKVIDFRFTARRLTIFTFFFWVTITHWYWKIRPYMTEWLQVLNTPISLFPVNRDTYDFFPPSE